MTIYGFCLLAFHLQSQHIVQILDDSICNWYKTLCWNNVYLSISYDEGKKPSERVSYSILIIHNLLNLIIFRLI